LYYILTSLLNYICSVPLKEIENICYCINLQGSQCMENFRQTYMTTDSGLTKFQFYVVSSILQLWPSYILNCHVAVLWAGGGAGACGAGGWMKLFGQCRILTKNLWGAQERDGFVPQPCLLRARHILLCWGACGWRTVFAIYSCHRQ
jgi:hypothetical protein